MDEKVPKEKEERGEKKESISRKIRKAECQKVKTGKKKNPPKGKHLKEKGGGN